MSTWHTIRWTRNSGDYHSGVSVETDYVFELVRGTSDNPLWWVREMRAGEMPQTVSALENLDAAKFYCVARDTRRGRI